MVEAKSSFWTRLKRPRVLHLGNKPSAAQTFRKALQLNPENEEVKGYLKQAEAR